MNTINMHTDSRTHTHTQTHTHTHTHIRSVLISLSLSLSLSSSLAGTLGSSVDVYIARRLRFVGRTRTSRCNNRGGVLKSIHFQQYSSRLSAPFVLTNRELLFTLWTFILGILPNLGFIGWRRPIWFLDSWVTFANQPLIIRLFCSKV